MKKNRKPLIIGNWKTNPSTLAGAKETFQKIKRLGLRYKKFELVICPPVPYISELSGEIRARNNASSPGIGAQDVSVYSEGSHTGEIGASMLRSAGAKYVIVGHSERRAMGETDVLVSMKIAQALKARLDVILCIGEFARDEHGDYLDFIKAQIRAALAGLSREEFDRMAIAYEPVWAIGRSDNAALSGHDLHQMVLYIKKFLREQWGDAVAAMVPILYGGSVFNENAHDILWSGQANGLLVGRASWTAESFGELLHALDESPDKKVSAARSGGKKTPKRSARKAVKKFAKRSVKKVQRRKKKS